ncbi:extracellular solute-binding protein [Paenibacillus sp. V4I7]|uniref:extracellular solute-binding protein n=1 Tax=Paenibacillus sp. V4I7 TaxID=3042307 RepID=UPI00278801A1|nr:extracellular solute-binding protein [Paenibacillus sp. V4I7]MDQ0899089.1 putative aldouronate transport system substrate-binding protein [Paenibacillus sp. V4I7]
MQKKKWMQTALTVSFVSAIVLAGCGGGGEKGNTASPAAGDSSSPQAAKSSAKFTIEMLKEGGSSSIPADNFVKKQIDSKLNVDFKLNLIANGPDMDNKLNVLAASNNLPDLMEIKNKALYQQLAKNGLLLDLDSYMGQLSGVKKLIGDDGFTKAKVNGKTYGFSRTPSFVPYSYWIRKDWLDKLGMKMPTTMDELYETAKAFAEKDPDGNGKKDTFGLVGDFATVMSPLYGYYGVGLPGAFYNKGDKMINSLYDPDMKKALETISKFVSTPGVFEPEFSSAKVTTAQDKAFKGQAGIFFDQWASIMKDDQVKTWKTANQNADWVVLPPLQGAQAVRTANIGPNGYIAIPKSLEKDKDKLNRILELLNYVSEGEGLNLVQYGVQDVHYKLDGSKVKLTEKASEANYTWLYQITGRPEMEYLSTKFPNQARYIQETAKFPEIKNYGPNVDTPDGYNAADVNRYVQEELLKFYVGKTPTADYDKFLNTLETKFNYKKLLEQGDKQLKELGYAK